MSEKLQEALQLAGVANMLDLDYDNGHAFGFAVFADSATADLAVEPIRVFKCVCSKLGLCSCCRNFLPSFFAFVLRSKLLSMVS